MGRLSFGKSKLDHNIKSQLKFMNWLITFFLSFGGQKDYDWRGG